MESDPEYDTSEPAPSLTPTSTDILLPPLILDEETAAHVLSIKPRDLRGTLTIATEVTANVNMRIVVKLGLVPEGDVDEVSMIPVKVEEFTGKTKTVVDVKMKGELEMTKVMLRSARERIRELEKTKVKLATARERIRELERNADPFGISDIYKSFQDEMERNCKLLERELELMTKESTFNAKLHLKEFELTSEYEAKKRELEGGFITKENELLKKEATLKSQYANIFQTKDAENQKLRAEVGSNDARIRALESEIRNLKFQLKDAENRNLKLRNDISDKDVRFRLLEAQVQRQRIRDADFKMMHDQVKVRDAKMKELERMLDAYKKDGTRLKLVPVVPQVRKASTPDYSSDSSSQAVKGKPVRLHLHQLTSNLPKKL